MHVRRKNRNFFLSMIKRREKKKIRRLNRLNNMVKFQRNSANNEFEIFIDKTKFNKPKKVKTYDNTVLKVCIPEIFSLIKNPEATINIYEMLYKAMKKNNITGVDIDYSQCKELEIGASTVMDVFMMNLKNYKENKIGKFTCRGNMPPNEKDKIALLASGILKRLKFPGINELVKELQDQGKLALLDLISGGKNTSTFKVDTSVTSDIVATNVSDYFEKCLNMEGLGINDEGKAYISSLVAETINNCELHSGNFKQFYTIGHYYSNENTTFGECQIVIFNFGQTIYEGLKYKTKNSETLNNLKAITNHHNKKGFFIKNVWDEEVLWTLYALQDGVSRVKSEDDPDRGTGTVQLIKSFQEIGGNLNGSKPEMSIVSGNSYIHFDGSYRISSENFESDSRDIIAFNKENDLYKAPDKKFVKKLNKFFPGTVISLNFFIDSVCQFKLDRSTPLR